MLRNKKGSIDSILVMIVTIPFIVYLMIFFIYVIMHFSAQTRVTTETYKLAKVIARSGKITTGALENYTKGLNTTGPLAGAFEYKVYSKEIKDDGDDGDWVEVVEGESDKSVGSYNETVEGGSLVKIYVTQKGTISKLGSALNALFKIDGTGIKIQDSVEMVVQKW